MYLFFSFFLRYIVLVHEVLWPFIDIHCKDDDGDDDDGDDDDASDDDGDASSIDEMSTGHSTLCHSWQKGEVVLNMRVVTLKGRISFWIIVLRGVLFFF